jgi:hypothetical protein
MNLLSTATTPDHNVNIMPGGGGGDARRRRSIQHDDDSMCACVVLYM